MTSRELVFRAMEFRRPERLPLSCPSFGVFDVVAVPYTAPADWRPSAEGEDEWGAVWVKTDIPNMGQMKRHPIDQWDDLGSYAFPDPDVESRYDRIRDIIEEHPDKYIVCLAETVLTLWERYYSLRRFQQALMDFLLHPREMHDLLERILSFHIGIMRNLGRRFAGRVHAFLVSDDWGIQHSTLVSVPLRREFFKARYRRLVAVIHDAGMHAILHSDGRINDLMPDLVEVGFDGFNLHSPTVVGIEEIGRDYAGRVAFWPCVDIQNTYARGTVEDVRREAWMLLRHWGTRDGGIIPVEYGREEVGASEQNLRAAFETFQALGIEACGRPDP